MKIQDVDSIASSALAGILILWYSMLRYVGNKQVRQSFTYTDSRSVSLGMMMTERKDKETANECLVGLVVAASSS